MRKLLFLLVLFLVGSTAFAQTLKLKFVDTQINQNINGQPINKGDEFDVWVWVNPNGNSTTRALYFDFEFQNTAFELVSVNHTGTGGNGGVIPYGSQITLSHYLYPGYSWLPTQYNSVENGNTRYQNAQYSYTGGGPKTILRAYLNWATQAGTNYPFYEGNLLKLRFKLKTDAPGYSWDPIRMNFAAAFNQDGSWGSTIMENPLTSIVGLDPLATTLLTAKIDLNENLQSIAPIKLAVIDTVTKAGPLFDITSDGTVNIDQAQLKPNTVYRVMAMINMDQMTSVYNAAVTVSDYTAAETEFVSQNLDGTYKNQNIQTGVGLFAADINRNKTFDGGDVVKIFSQSVSVDQLISLPPGYAPGSNGHMSIPTFLADEFNNMDLNSWKTAKPFVLVTTDNYGVIKNLDLKYLLWGDINRSHSSKAVDPQGVIKVNSFVNTPNQISGINVSLNSVVVTSDVIEIPIQINTQENKLSGLQFEFLYDETKIKFEELLSNLPNGWYVFGSPKDGKIKFGAVDKELKNSVSGELTVFKLKFSTLVPGVDLTTQVKVSKIMDASDNKGNQLGINLNTTTIKLTGYNKFN